MQSEVLNTQITIPGETLAQIQRNLTVKDLIDEWVVDSSQMAEALDREVRGIDSQFKALDEVRKSITKPAREIEERTNAFFRPALNALSEASQAGRSKLLTWKRAEDARIAEENRKREEAARKARQEAEAQAAAARARAEQEAAEARRKAAEAEEARRKAEAEGNARAAAKAAAEAAAAEQKAQAAIENGQAKAEQALIESASAAPVLIAESTIAKNTGIRENWKATPDGKDWKLRLIRFVAANPQYENLLEYDESAGNKLAKALKGAMQIDGLRAEDQGSLVLGRRAE